MITLFNSKDYNWALFIGHIVIERLLKAYYVQIKNDHAPFTHDLLRLVQMSELEIDNEKADWILLLHLILMPDMITIIRNFIKNVHMNLLNIG